MRRFLGRTISFSQHPAKNKSSSHHHNTLKATLLEWPWSDSHRIQTCNLLIRSQMLYSVELASRNKKHYFVTRTGFKPVTF